MWNQQWFCEVPRAHLFWDWVYGSWILGGTGEPQNSMLKKSFLNLIYFASFIIILHRFPSSLYRYRLYHKSGCQTKKQIINTSWFIEEYSWTIMKKLWISTKIPFPSPLANLPCPPRSPATCRCPAPPARAARPVQPVEPSRGTSMVRRAARCQRRRGIGHGRLWPWHHHGIGTASFSQACIICIGVLFEVFFGPK